MIHHPDKCPETVKLRSGQNGMKSTLLKKPVRPEKIEKTEQPSRAKKTHPALDALLKNKKILAAGIAVLSVIWFYACPEKTIIPVRGARPADWNPDFFWDCPWCTRFYKHKGIDIIRDEGTPIVAATDGIILYTGWLGIYGKAVVIMSPKLRVHLYGHMSGQNNYLWPIVFRGTRIGAVGNTGTSGCPHLHYTIFSILPRFWLFEPRNMGWLKIFFLNPDKIITAH